MPSQPNVIKVAIVGDASGLQKGTKQGVSALSGFGKAISPLVGQSGILGDLQTEIDGVGAAFDTLGKKGNIGAKLTGIGGAAVGIGVGLTTLGAKGKQAGDQLSQAIDNAGGSYSDYASKIDAAVKHQEGFGNS